MDKITIIKPDDWHLHLRDGKELQSIVNFSANQMGRGVIMPNLNPPITTTKQALNYKNKIIKALNKNLDFQPLMTLYLTDNTQISEVEIAKKNNILGFKLYPAGVTTNSDLGVRNIKNIYPILTKMQKIDMPLLIHGEVANKTVDIFDREAVFIDKILNKLTQDFPELRIVFEHITTSEAVDFVLESSANIAATITPQHLLNNRNHMLASGIKPHYFCLPILKREKHRKALIKAATSGNPKFFLGTDSAPHAKSDKESNCGCAGCFSAPFAIELYATAFSKVNKIEKLEGFSAIFGAKFYKKNINTTKITLIKEIFKINKKYKFGNKVIIPYGFKDNIDWKIIY